MHLLTVTAVATLYHQRQSQSVGNVFEIFFLQLRFAAVTQRSAQRHRHVYAVVDKRNVRHHLVVAQLGASCAVEYGNTRFFQKVLHVLVLVEINCKVRVGIQSDLTALAHNGKKSVVWHNLRLHSPTGETVRHAIGLVHYVFTAIECVDYNDSFHITPVTDILPQQFLPVNRTGGLQFSRVRQSTKQSEHFKAFRLYLTSCNG